MNAPWEKQQRILITYKLWLLLCTVHLNEQIIKEKKHGIEIQESLEERRDDRNKDRNQP